MNFAGSLARASSGADGGNISGELCLDDKRMEFGTQSEYVMMKNILDYLASYICLLKKGGGN